MKNNWNKDLYGGNKGVVTTNDNPPAGIVKNVAKPTRNNGQTEEKIIDEIKVVYPNANVDLFKRNDKFTGTI